MLQNQSQRFLALPAAGEGPGVVVLHAWWGLTGMIKDFSTRLAQEGFVVMAPDLFSGTVASTIEEAEQHMTQWDEARDVPPILLPSIDEFLQHPAVRGDGLDIIGFSMGAYWSLWLAQEKPEIVRSVTLFYGTNGGEGDFQRSQAAFLGHFAENDPYEPPDNVEAMERTLRQAGRPATFYHYPGTGHWFFEPDQKDAYSADAARLAWERTLAFLKSSSIK